MNSPLKQRKQHLTEQVAVAKASLDALREQLRKADAEVDDLVSEQPKYDALRAAVDALSVLDGQNGAELFWGESKAADAEGLLHQAQARAQAFSESVQSCRDARAKVLAACEAKADELDDLDYHLSAVTLAAEDEVYDFVVERELVGIQYKRSVMPWETEEEDRRRLRKVLLIAFLVMFVIGVVPQVWQFPEPDPNKKIEVPDRLVQMLKKKQPPKPIEQPKQVKQEEEKPKDVAKKEDRPKPTEQQVKKARKTAQTKGVLAFSDSFSDMIEDADVSNLGADARVSDAGSQSLGGAPGSRSMLAAQATGSSGGIANARISRGGVGAGGSGISGVEAGQVESSVSIAARDAARPVSSGVGPARTDEEIQIVFDRYKSALYRIYNRELRNDPTLRGKMVLAITIEPDGSVSACKVQSTDMNSATLSAEIVERVKRFNFGAKEGVPATKILYPIDFLPAG